MEIGQMRRLNLEFFSCDNPTAMHMCYHGIWWLFLCTKVTDFNGWMYLNNVCLTPKTADIGVYRNPFTGCNIYIFTSYSEQGKSFFQKTYQIKSLV